jgi:hypothetical protein
LAPEVSAELKYITYQTHQLYAQDDLNGDIQRKDFENSVVCFPSFISIVEPFTLFGKRVVFSVYRQESVNYESSYTTDEEIIFGEYQAILWEVDALARVNITNYGIGAALQVFENFSLAVSPRWAIMNMQSHVTRSTDEEESRIDDNDQGFGVNAGLLWHIHPRISIGGVYKKGPLFQVTEEPGRFADDTIGIILDPESSGYDPDMAEFTVKVPDSFGIGLSARVTDALTILLDVIYIRYEDLLTDFDVSDFHAIDSIIEIEEGGKENFTIDNAVEIHFGGEYMFRIGERFLALRAGVYNEPDHIIRFTGTTGDPLSDSCWKELFPGGKDQIHITGGLGLVLNDSLQIDTAVNIADKQQQFSISGVQRF